jgi:hypothetical protein
MSKDAPITGGCLCGALRYEAKGPPLYAGHCYCADCRKASGAPAMAFMGFRREQLTFTGASREYRSPSLRGSDAHRNRCPVCASLVFGGERDISDSFTIYVGSLDDPSVFEARVAIFNRDRPHWVVVPEGIDVHETMPGF